MIDPCNLGSTNSPRIEKEDPNNPRGRKNVRPNLFDRRGRRNQKEILNRMVNVKRMLMPLRVSREGYHDTSVIYMYILCMYIFIWHPTHWVIEANG